MCCYGNLSDVLKVPNSVTCVCVCVCMQKKLVLLQHNIYAILNFRQVFFHSINISIRMIFN